MHKAKARNYGIDVLRLISMFFIITLHTLYHGEITNTCKPGTINHAVSTLLITIVWCGVDIFAIISGFVGYGYERENRYMRFFLFWVRVAAYSGLISLVFYFIKPGSVKRIRGYDENGR